MFSKTKPEVQKTFSNDRKPSSPSVLSADLSVVGNLTSEGEIHLDCQLEGDIHCKTLLVGVNGNVSGSVHADLVRVHGAISGKLFARSVFLATTARMLGDITHQRIEIEPGAYIEGLCRHMADPIPAEAPAEDLMITDERPGKDHKNGHKK